jgi:hypothetical protein
MALALSTAKLEEIRKSLPPPLTAAVRPASEISAARELPLPTGVDALDRLLGGGLCRGALVELSGRRSCGRFAVGLAALAAATQRGENAALVDLGDGLTPGAAQAAGADLARLLWLRPRRLKVAVASAEAALAAGFALVVLDLGAPPLPGGRVPEASWIRLARGARATGAALLLSSPYPLSGSAAEAAVAVARLRAAWQGHARSPRLLAGLFTRFLLEKRRGARPGREESAGFRCGEAIASFPCAPRVPAAPHPVVIE